MVESRRLGRCASREKILSSVMKLTISTLALCATVRDSECKIGKCCPDGEVLTIFKEFKCWFVEGKGERMIHQLNRDESKAGFQCPAGENVTITALKNIVDRPVLWQSACIDILYGIMDRISIPVIFQCGPKESSENAVATESIALPDLPNLRTCCGNGQLFDFFDKVCVSEEKIMKWRGKLYVPKDNLLCRADGAVAAATGSLADSNFFTLRICCRTDKVYSVDKRECVTKTGSRNVPKYFNFLNERFDFITVVRGVPPCKHALLDHVVDATRDLRVQDDGGIEVFLNKTNGRESIIVNENNACLDRGDSSASNLVVFRICSDSRFCKEHPCVRKCCPDDQASVWNICDDVPKNAPPGYFHDVLLNESIERGLASHKSALNVSDYGLLIGIPCKDTDFVEVQDTWEGISTSGYVYLSNGRSFGHDDYCLEMSRPSGRDTSHISLRICVESLNEYLYKILIVHGVFEWASCAFLIITLFVYICLPILRNLRGKILMCHMAGLVVGYACYAIITVVSIPSVICPFLAYAAFFSWISAHSWLNVLCFDMWRTLRGNIWVATLESQGDTHYKRFLLYSLYAWGYSFMVSILCLADNGSDFVRGDLLPAFDIDSCGFIRYTRENLLYGESIFFLVPVSLQLVANVIFFMLTARHCNRIKTQITHLTASAIEPRSQRFLAARKELIINIKLFMVMGLTFIIVLIFTGILYSDAGLYWHIGLIFAQDVVNCLHGITIFYLFVVNGRVYNALLDRFGRKTINNIAPAGKDENEILDRSSVSALLSYTILFTVLPIKHSRSPTNSTAHIGFPLHF